MSNHRIGILHALGIALATIAVLAGTAPAATVGSSFTYQGSLSDGGSALTGVFDFRFTLFDAASGGALAGSPITFDDLQVVSGVFTADLDFGSSVFFGDARWLQVEVRPGVSTGSYTLLPRQRLSPTPYAIGVNLPLYEQASSTTTMFGLLNTGTGSCANFIAGGNGPNSGVSGGTLSTTAQASGVRGTATGSTGLVYGVYGSTASTASQTAGVYGVATATTGTTIGVQGIATASSNGTGIVGTGSATGAYISSTGTGSVGLYSYGGGTGVYARATGGLSTGLYSYGTYRGIYAESDGFGAAIEARRTTGTGHLILAANTSGDQFWVDNAGVTHSKVLEIIGGSDLSERFDVHGATARIEPGMVVSIDPEHEGRLTVSGEPYDHRVAGVISGAGGVRPGMLMGQNGSIATGDQPVALTGRVYCRATAANGPIVPGDLLTTSSIPGHAMRVADPSRAAGAILGKAMGSLAEGEGLVLVLVGLQ
jgi:hypothetical protein